MKFKDSFDLSNRVAIVTGGAGAIGEACAKGLADFGAQIALVDSRCDAAAATTEKIAAEYQVKAQPFSCDITDSSAVNALIDEISLAFDKIDILLNCVGICIPHDAERFPDEDWQKIINTNLTAAFWLSRAVVQKMIPQKRGSIIHIASMSGSIVNVPQNIVAYNTSKAGMIHMVHTLAAEWAQHNIRVNCISPGYTMTPMTACDQQNFERWHSLIPMGRMCQPEELAGAAVYLASDAASYTTGHNLIVDGGYTLW